MDKKLSGKTAIVTGANSGIGKGVAIALAEAGATIVINYVTHKEVADAVMHEIKNNGGNAITIMADVSKVDHALIVHLAMPNLASEDFKVNYPAPSFRFTIQHNISKNMSLGYNLGAEWDGFSPKPTYIYTLTSGFGIKDSLGGFVEIYGFLEKDNLPNYRILSGLTYLISPNFMIDISTGFGISKTAPKLYYSFGFSFRLQYRKG